jgi:hypothetical protein
MKGKLVFKHNLRNHQPGDEKMPVLFLGQGSPMNAIEENEFVDGFRNIGKSIPKPNAILKDKAVAGSLTMTPVKIG